MSLVSFLHSELREFSADEADKIIDWLQPYISEGCLMGEISNAESLEKCVEIYYNYAFALNEKGRYNDLLDEIEEVLPVIEDKIYAFEI